MKRSVAATLSIVVWLLAPCIAKAEDSTSKYRVSVSIGDQSTSSEIHTNATNQSSFLKPEGGVEVIDDPRPDSADKNKAGIKDALRYDLQVSYGLWRTKWGELSIDSSIGQMKGDVGDLEVAAQFNVVDPPRTRDCGELVRYHLFFIPLGQITETPVQIGSTFRFRPKATGGPFRGMRPWLGAGVGYIFAKFDGSDEFLRFSDAVSRSTGFYQKPNFEGGATAGKTHQFKAAEVDAKDSFEYHATGGIDFPIKKGFSIFFSAGFMWANEGVRVTTDGREEFGSAIPSGQTHKKYPRAGLPAIILDGGFIDYASGRPLPREGLPCKFKLGPKDGIPDTGNYYVQGGEIDYSSYTIALGGRYQF